MSLYFLTSPVCDHPTATTVSEPGDEPVQACDDCGRTLWSY